MTPEITKLIEDGRWQPIEEAPLGVKLFIRSKNQNVGGRYVHHINTKHTVEDFCKFCLPCNHPTHFRPLPDNRLADALAKVYDGLVYMQGFKSDATFTGAEIRRMAEKLIAEIQAIAERKE